MFDEFVFACSDEASALAGADGEDGAVVNGRHYTLDLVTA